MKRPCQYGIHGKNMDWSLHVMFMFVSVYSNLFSKNATSSAHLRLIKQAFLMSSFSFLCLTLSLNHSPVELVLWNGAPFSFFPPVKIYIF